MTSSLRAKLPMFSYVITCMVVFFIASRFLDLPPLIGNWESKSLSILNFELKDNYYPPGAALALIPFLWNGPDFWLAIYFYYALSAFVYFKLCEIVPSRKLRILALSALPANAYLTWLCLTSADQVVELLMLLTLGLFATRNQFLPALFFGFFLCFTRPAYWVAYLIIIYVMGRKQTKGKSFRKGILKKAAGLGVLLGVISFNQLVFDGPNLSTSSSGTIFLSHQKFHYLSLPKFDMDVFLTNGPSTNPESVSNTSNQFEFIEDQEIRGAFISVSENPQRFIFAQLQKIDSYFFPIEKVPNLPGRYELAPDEKSILIVDERLTWSLTIGHLLFAIYRAFWMFLFAITLTWFGLLVWSRSKSVMPERILLVPYLAGIVPGLLYYVETRFKICSELLAVPLQMIALYHLRRISQSRNFKEFLLQFTKHKIPS